MTNQLVNIALASTFYEKKRNYLETYFPFVLKIFENNNICDLFSIRDELKRIFEIEMPMHSIKKLVSDHEGSHFKIIKARKDNWEITLTLEGEKYLADLIQEYKNEETKLKEFYYSFIEFVKKKYDVTCDVNEVEIKIKKFIINNLILVSMNKLNFSDNIISSDVKFEKMLIEYLLYIKKHSLNNTKTFDEIWKGIVIWNELSKTELENESHNFNKKVKVLVDSNYVLSLLELHNEFCNQAAKELHDLLVNNSNIELFILDKTLDEISTLLSQFESYKNSYYQNENEIDSIYYYMLKKEYTVVKVARMLDSLRDDLLIKHNIQTSFTSDFTGEYMNIYNDIYHFLYDKKVVKNQRLNKENRRGNFSIEKSAEHDAHVITYIIKNKNRVAPHLDGCKYIFLTSSSSLFHNYRRISKKYEKYPSVILDATFANILYLKNPKTNIGLSIDNVIKVHSNYLIIDNHVWIKYSKLLKEMIDDSMITQEDYGRLVSKNQFTEMYLLKNNESDKISKEGVIDVLGQLKSKELINSNKLKEYEDTEELMSREIKDKEITLKKVRTENKRKELKIKGLQNSIFNLEKEKYEKKIKESFDKYFQEKIKKFKIRIGLYILFIAICIIFFVLSKIPFPFLDEINKKIVNRLIVEILPYFLFLLPFGRALIDHKLVRKSFKVLFSKKEREFFRNNEYSSYKIEYESNEPPPKLEDLIDSIDN